MTSILALLSASLLSGYTYCPNGQFETSPGDGGVYICMTPTGLADGGNGAPCPFLVFSNSGVPAYVSCTGAVTALGPVEGQTFSTLDGYWSVNTGNSTQTGVENLSTATWATTILGLPDGGGFTAELVDGGPLPFTALQYKAVGVGPLGGYAYADGTWTSSAGTPLNGLQGLQAAGEKWCALSGSQLNGATLHFCAGEYSGGVLTPDVGPAPTSYPAPTTVTGPIGQYSSGLMGDGSNWQFEWNAANNPLAFGWDAGFTYFETFTLNPSNGELATDLGGLLDGSSYAIFVTQSSNPNGLIYFSSGGVLLPDGGPVYLADGGLQPFQQGPNTATFVYQPNTVAGFCGGVGPDGGVALVKICGPSYAAILPQVSTLPYGWGGTQSSNLVIGDKLSAHEVLISNIPATEGYCTKLCQEALQLPTYIESIGDSITAGVSLDVNNVAYPNQLQTYLGNSSNEVTNHSVPGVNASYCYGNEWEQFRYSSTGIVTWLCGTNDLVIGTAPSVIEGYTQSFVNEAISDGLRVILYTLPPNASAYDAGYAPNYLAYNAWLMGAPDGGLQPRPNLTVIDAYSFFSNPANSGIGAPGYYDSSGIYPTFFGSYVLANLAYQVIQTGNVLWVPYTDGGVGSISVPSIPGIDTSAMFGGNGQAAWFSHPSYAEPTDNLAPKSSQFAGIVSSGSIVTQGEVTAQFTTVGGQPAAGSPVYLAAGTDDSNTGMGKLTATRPITATLADVINFNGTVPESVVIVGTAVDCTLYASNKTCLVAINGPKSPELPQATDQQFIGSVMGPFDSSDYLSAAYNANGATMNSGETLIVAFTVDSAFGGLGAIIGNINSGLTNGWILYFSSALTFNEFVAGVNTQISLDTPRAGLNIVAITITGGNMRVAMNNNAVVTAALASTATPSSSGAFRLGWGAGAALTAWTSGGVSYVEKLNRAMSDNELLQYTNGSLFPVPPANRFVPPPALTADAALEFYWTANSGANVFVPGGGGSAYWTINGTPKLQVRTEQWYHSLAPYFVDSEPVYYDSVGNPRASAFAQLEWVQNNTNQDLCVGIREPSSTDWDNDSPGLFIDGVWTQIVPSQVTPDNLTHYFWVPIANSTLDAGYHNLSITNSTLSQIFGSEQSIGEYVVELAGVGPQQTFATNTATARLVFVGDQNANGQDAAPPTDTEIGAVTLLRQDFPTNGGRFAPDGGTGSVFSESGFERALQHQYAAAGGSVTPFCKRIIDDGNLGTANGYPPKFVVVYIALGYNDYAYANWTPTQFAAAEGALADCIHSAQPTWPIYVQRITQYDFCSIANGAYGGSATGYTECQFNTAIVSEATGRGYLTIVDANPDGGVIGWNGSPPHQIMSTAGIVTYKGIVKSAVNY